MFFKTFCLVLCIALWFIFLIPTPSVTAVASESPHSRFKRVIGGAPLRSRSSAPWIVLLKNKRKACSGVLITKRWILTAGHCFRRPDKPKRWTATIGYPVINTKYSVLYTKNGSFQLRSLKPRKNEIDSIVVHPKFFLGDFNYDIALVRLSGRHSHQRIYKTVNVIAPREDREVQPVPLPHVRQRVYKKGQKCVMIGFGPTKEKKDNKGLIQAHYIEMPIHPTWKCRQYYKLKPPSKPFCAGYLGQGKGASAGDSGGPLVCTSRGGYTLTGIVIQGHSKKPQQFPAIFIRVKTFLPWIKSVIGKSQRRKGRRLGPFNSTRQIP